MVADNQIQNLADIPRVNADRWPDRAALQEMDAEGTLRALTFSDLRDRIDSFATRLRLEGLDPGDRAGIIMPNNSRWVVAYFAILTSGAVAVPLEYDFLEKDPDALSFAIRHSDCDLVLADPPDANDVRTLSDCPILHVPEEIPDYPESPPEVNPQDRPDIAQILYTSGTTGHKKGVVLTHRSLLCNVRQCVDRFGVYPDDSLPALLPFHHAYPLTTTVLLPLYAGALMTVGDVRSKQLRELLPASKPTVLVGVPRFYESLLGKIRKLARSRGDLGKLESAMSVSAWLKRWTGLNVGKLLFGKIHKQLFGGRQLRFCISGGARISERVVRDYLKLGVALLQGWGMTELAPVAAVQPYSPWKFYFTRHYERKTGSIGTPLLETEVELVDCPSQGVQVERDGKGEMIVRGPQMMERYHEDPEETRMRKRLEGLRTGDIARRDGDGHLYIVGRAKHVIVLPTGKKVFPEENLYEDLSRCQLIDEFAVKSVVDEERNERIGIVVRPDSEVLIERGIQTVGQMYQGIRDEILESIRHKPSYLKNFDLCVTPLEDGEFKELTKNTVRETCPARIDFRDSASFQAVKDSTQPLGLQAQRPTGEE